MFGRPGAIIFEITDGDGFYYRGNIFYDLVKISVIRLAFAMSKELRKKGVTALALTPGFLRSEAMLENYKTTEATWKEVGKRKAKASSPDPNDDSDDFMISESTRYVGSRGGGAGLRSATCKIRVGEFSVLGIWRRSTDLPM